MASPTESQTASDVSEPPCCEGDLSLFVMIQRWFQERHTPRYCFYRRSENENDSLSLVCSDLPAASEAVLHKQLLGLIHKRPVYEDVISIRFPTDTLRPTSLSSSAPTASTTAASPITPTTPPTIATTITTRATTPAIASLSAQAVSTSNSSSSAAVSARLHEHVEVLSTSRERIPARTAAESARASTSQFIIYYGSFRVAEVQYVLCFLLSNTSEDLVQMFRFELNSHCEEVRSLLEADPQTDLSSALCEWYRYTITNFSTLILGCGEQLGQLLHLISSAAKCIRVLYQPVTAAPSDPTETESLCKQRLQTQLSLSSFQRFIGAFSVAQFDARVIAGHPNELLLVPPHLAQSHSDPDAECISAVRLESSGRVVVSYGDTNEFCQQWAQHLRAGVGQTIADPFQQRNRSLFFKERLIKDLNDTRRAAYQSITNHYSLHRLCESLQRNTNKDVQLSLLLHDENNSEDMTEVLQVLREFLSEGK
mmetsp:Transcript_8214/g.25434  ORF Transcript_8214/g.25434 Transcript_8214/m.25434 type:complete len:482 (+) Transcript_8214:120-1565(+)